MSKRRTPQSCVCDMGGFTKRERLAHAALQATLRYLRDPANPKIGTAFDDATQQLCPICEHAIVYCRCYGSTFG